MHRIIIFTVGEWRFAVREEDVSMIADCEKKPVGMWQDIAFTAALKDINAINETRDNHFSNFIYFSEHGRIFCLGVNSMSYPSKENAENLFYLEYSGESDGIIGLYTDNEDIISVVDLGKFLGKWLGSETFI